MYFNSGSNENTACTSKTNSYLVCTEKMIKNDNELVFKQIKLFVNYYVSLENKVNVYQFVHVLCNSTDH